MGGGGTVCEVDVGVMKWRREKRRGKSERARCQVDNYEVEKEWEIKV